MVKLAHGTTHDMHLTWHLSSCPAQCSTAGVAKQELHQLGTEIIDCAAPLITNCVIRTLFKLVSGVACACN